MGMWLRSANAVTVSPTDWDQPGPPTMSTGRRALPSLRAALRGWLLEHGAAAGGAMLTGAVVGSYWTSSGTTSTTGPGRPLWATCIAAATRWIGSAASIVSTALADEPNTSS